MTTIAPLDAAPPERESAPPSPRDDTTGHVPVLVGPANVLVSGLLGAPLLLVTGLAIGLGVSFSVLLVGVVLLILWLVILDGIANLERRRVRAVYDVECDRPEPLPDTLTGFRRMGAYLGDRLRSGRYWKAVAHLHLDAVIGSVVASFVLFLVYSAVEAVVSLVVERPYGPLAEIAAVLSRRDGSAAAPQPLLVILAVVAVIVAYALAYVTAHLEKVLARWLLQTDPTSALRTQVTRVARQRQEAVDAADIERRRIERDLHDGAQPRLVAVAMTLGMAQRKIDADPDAAKELIGEAHEETKAAIAELRQIVRGIHPAVLADRGLDAALSAIAARSPIPVDLQVDVPGRLPSEQETVAYFVVAEALTNVAKHSGATAAQVRVGMDPRPLPRPQVRIHVHDDGRGGARPDASGVSTGLKGLGDRVAAAGGSITLHSPAGGPTDLTVVLPLPVGGARHGTTGRDQNS